MIILLVKINMFILKLITKRALWILQKYLFLSCYCFHCCCNYTSVAMVDLIPADRICTTITNIRKSALWVLQLPHFCILTSHVKMSHSCTDHPNIVVHNFFYSFSLCRRCWFWDAAIKCHWQKKKKWFVQGALCSQ